MTTPTRRALKILVVDVGGTHVKILATGQREERKADSGPTMTARGMVAVVKRLSADWSYDHIAIGYPGPVLHGRPVAEPRNLGRGWVDFDFHRAFGRPVKMINDAAMQALGNYRGGRMLFLGVGTGLGSALIVDGVLEPLELAHLPYKNAGSFEQKVGAAALERVGEKKWTKKVFDIVEHLKDALQVEYVALGGGNSKRLTTLPPATIRSADDAAREGGFSLWH